MPSIWRRSGMVEFDNSGNAAAGAKGYFFQGGTTTPLTVYSDANEATPHEHPLEADSNGRWPVVYVPFSDTGFDEKVTTSGGTQLTYYEEIPNADPVEASEDSVDDAELIATGDVIWTPVGGTRTGFVRCNGRTMGNAASGATERANADTSALFTYLWNGLANDQAAVSGGRGASASADYAANKTITLLDLRFATIKGVADMGNSTTTVNGAVTINGGATANTAGASVGSQVVSLSTAQLAAHTHDVGTYATVSGGAHTHGLGSVTAASNGAHTHGVTDPGHTHVANQPSANATFTSTGGGPNASNPFTASATASSVTGVSVVSDGAHTHTLSGAMDSGGAHTHSLSGASASEGSGSAHNNEPPAILGTFYCKL
jgi:hypothetical protein